MALYLLHGKNPCKLSKYPDLMSIFAKERVHIRSLECDKMILKYVKAGNIFAVRFESSFLQSLH